MTRRTHLLPTSSVDQRSTMQKPQSKCQPVHQPDRRWDSYYDRGYCWIVADRKSRLALSSIFNILTPSSM